MNKFELYALTHLFVIFLAGCSAGSGENLDQNGQPLDVSNNEIQNVDVSNKANLTWIQDNVFSAICSACHAGANPAAGQNLSTLENSIQNLIGVQSSNPEFLRVKPGEPETSYLILKITGDPRAGARMPLGLSPLPDDTIAAIREWIRLGALVPDSALVSTQISRTQMTSAKQIGNRHSLTLTLWFNREMDLNTLPPSSLLVEAHSAEAVWHVEPNQVHISALSTSSAAITIKELTNDIQKLTIRVNNPNISSITSSNGQLLDGDYDDKEGGEFIYEHQL